MTRFLLDTDTCIEYLRRREPPIRVRFGTTPNADIVLCSVVKAELHFGALRSVDPSAEQARLRKFLVGFVSLAFDDVAAET